MYGNIGKYGLNMFDYLGLSWKLAQIVTNTLS